MICRLTMVNAWSMIKGSGRPVRSDVLSTLTYSALAVLDDKTQKLQGHVGRKDVRVCPFFDSRQSVELFANILHHRVVSKGRKECRSFMCVDGMHRTQQRVLAGLCAAFFPAPNVRAILHLPPTR